MVLFYMTQFINQIQNERVGLQKCFSPIINQFIKHVNDITKLFPYFISCNICDSLETANYLLELALVLYNNDNENKLIFEQFGLNMLYRLKKYDVILNYFFKNKSIKEIMNCFKNLGNNLSSRQISKLLRDNRDFFIKNKKMFVKFN